MASKALNILQLLGDEEVVEDVFDERGSHPVLEGVWIQPHFVEVV